MDEDRVRKLTRRRVARVLNHPRDEKTGRLKVQAAPQPAVSRREAYRRRYAEMGWPAHRVEEKLRQLFGK
jgi:hypothetical protein